MRYRLGDRGAGRRRARDGPSRRGARGLCEALRISVSRHDLSTVLCTLAGAALLSAVEGDKARAVELYTLVARYPIFGDSPQLKLYAGERMPAIIATLPADVVAAAQARGQAADPFVAAEALLTEWGG